MKTLRFYLITVFSLVPLFLNAATLTGPQTADVGRMVTVESNVMGDWIVYPPDRADIAKDSGEKTLFLVARQEGTFTVIFFGVENGKAVISTQEIIIGAKPEPEPIPEPEPLPNFQLTPKEKEAAISAFQAVIQGIDAGTIRSPQGARSSFKQTLTQKAQICNGTYCTISKELSAALDSWTEQTDFTSLEAVKTSFKKILEGLQ